MFSVSKGGKSTWRFDFSEGLTWSRLARRGHFLVRLKKKDNLISNWDDYSCIILSNRIESKSNIRGKRNYDNTIIF